MPIVLRIKIIEKKLYFVDIKKSIKCKTKQKTIFSISGWKYKVVVLIDKAR